jgi:hypothetical protein
MPRKRQAKPGKGKHIAYLGIGEHTAQSIEKLLLLPNASQLRGELDRIYHEIPQNIFSRIPGKTKRDFYSDIAKILYQALCKKANVDERIRQIKAVKDFWSAAPGVRRLWANAQGELERAAPALDFLGMNAESKKALQAAAMMQELREACRTLGQGDPPFPPEVSPNTIQVWFAVGALYAQLHLIFQAKRNVAALIAGLLNLPPGVWGKNISISAVEKILARYVLPQYRHDAAIRRDAILQ